MKERRVVGAGVLAIENRANGHFNRGGILQIDLACRVKPR
jgi:hypothetical protein